MKERTQEALGRLSFVVGVGFIITSMGDYAGHLWGRPSPHPWWGPLIFAFLGVLLLFPDRLGLGVEYAIRLLPWLSDKGDV